MRCIAIGVLGVLAACGGSSNNNGGDAPGGDGRAIDARQIDAAIDAEPIDAAPAGCTSHCVVSAEEVPATNTEAMDEGLDLNADGTVDNQFGQVLAALSTQGFGLQSATDTAITHGDAITLIDFEAGAGSAATFATFVGTDPVPAACSSAGDATCGHQLSGHAMFTVGAGSNDTPLAGTTVGGTYNAGPGHLTLQTALFGAPLALDLIGARVQAMPTAGGLPSAIIAGGVPTPELTAKVYPSIAASAQAQVVATCTALTSPPACGCPDGSEAKTYLGLFDTSPADCHITSTEVANNALIMSLFASDVTLEGKAALSFGMKVTLVGAVFTAP